jgi:hypothetical protein
MNRPTRDDLPRDTSERPARAAVRGAAERGQRAPDRAPLPPAASALDEALAAALDRISREWAIEL